MTLKNKAVYVIVAVAVAAFGFAGVNARAADFFAPWSCGLGGNNSPLGANTAAPPADPGRPGDKAPAGTQEPGVDQAPVVELLAVTIAPGTAELSIGKSASFSAVAVYSDNSARVVTGEAAWDPGSTFTATAAGTFTVTAIYQGRSAAAAVTVKEPAVTALIVSPEQSEIKAGVTVSFSAQATFEDGSSRDVTAESSWSPASSFTGREPGTFAVSAAFKGVSGTARMTVKEPQVTGLALTPAQATIKPGGSVNFKATASFANGSSRDVTAASTWSPASTFAGSQVGEFSVSATYEGQSAVATVRVEALRVTALAISPAQKTIKLNESVSFKAVATFEDGSIQTVTSEAVWAPGSSFTGTAEGTFAVAATYKGQQAAAAVTVEGPKKRDAERPPRPPPQGSGGGYDPTKDPGMGGKPPDITGATQAGAQGAGGGRQPGDTAGTPPPGLGGGEVTPLPPTEPPTDAPSGGREPQPAPGGGWWCYAAPTQEWYQVPMGPCPPSSWKPPRGPATKDPAVRVPHDTLQRDPGKGDKPTGKPGKPLGQKPSPGPADKPTGKPGKPQGATCGPATSCRCAGGGMGHIPCDKSKGACHCGEG